MDPLEPSHKAVAVDAVRKYARNDKVFKKNIMDALAESEKAPQISPLLQKRVNVWVVHGDLNYLSDGSRFRQKSIPVTPLAYLFNEAGKEDSSLQRFSFFDARVQMGKDAMFEVEPVVPNKAPARIDWNNDVTMVIFSTSDTTLTDRQKDQYNQAWGLFHMHSTNVVVMLTPLWDSDLKWLNYTIPEVRRESMILGFKLISSTDESSIRRALQSADMKRQIQLKIDSLLERDCGLLGHGAKNLWLPQDTRRSFRKLAGHAFDKLQLVIYAPGRVPRKGDLFGKLFEFDEESRAVPISKYPIPKLFRKLRCINILSIEKWHKTGSVYDLKQRKFASIPSAPNSWPPVTQIRVKNETLSTDVLKVIPGAAEARDFAIVISFEKPTPGFQQNRCSAYQALLGWKKLADLHTCWYVSALRKGPDSDSELKIPTTEWIFQKEHGTWYRFKRASFLKDLSLITPAEEDDVVEKFKYATRIKSDWKFDSMFISFTGGTFGDEEMRAAINLARAEYCKNAFTLSSWQKVSTRKSPDFFSVPTTEIDAAFPAQGILWLSESTAQHLDYKSWSSPIKIKVSASERGYSTAVLNKYTAQFVDAASDFILSRGSLDYYADIPAEYKDITIEVKDAHQDDKPTLSSSMPESWITFDASSPFYFEMTLKKFLEAQWKKRSSHLAVL